MCVLFDWACRILANDHVARFRAGEYLHVFVHVGLRDLLLAEGYNKWSAISEKCAVGLIATCREKVSTLGRTETSSCETFVSTTVGGSFTVDRL
jgi:hypothetical protein